MRIGSINLLRVPGTVLVQYGGKIYAMVLVEGNPVVNRTHKGVYLNLSFWPDTYKGDDVTYITSRIGNPQEAMSFSDEKRAAFQPRVGMVFAEKKPVIPLRVEKLQPDSVIKVDLSDGDDIKPL